MDQTLLIYKDKGVSFPSYLATQRMLMGLPYALTCINAEQLTHSDWEANCAALFFPGGRDIPYHNALSGQANCRIRKYVKNGGRYFGICAGGYYGAQEIEFEKGGKHEVIASRELEFFPGRAVGTLFGEFEYDSEQSSCHTPIDLASTTHSLYYNGGCYFDVKPEHTDIDILGRYTDYQEKAAIINCRVGDGNALLSGVHYEFPSNEYQMLINQLLQSLL